VHGSVLQNKKYIKFAYENTVEVLALGRLDEAVQKGERGAETYKGDDGKDYLVGWPNLTVEDVANLRSSKAGSYNNTGKIPYTSIVNPHTLEEMESIQGGYGAGTLMDKVEEHKKALEKEYGKSVSRKALEKIEKTEADVRADVTEGKFSKAMAAARKLDTQSAKLATSIQERTKALVDEVLKACAAQLDEAEKLLGDGDASGAKKILSGLSSALRGTDLEERHKELTDKASGS